MKTYVLNRPIGAVMLKDPLTATTLPEKSQVKMIGPAKQIHGFVEVECKDHHYAVFQHDLDEWGEITRSAAE